MIARKGEVTILVAVMLLMVLIVMAVVAAMVALVRDFSETPDAVAPPSDRSALKAAARNLGEPVERPDWVDEQAGLSGNVFNETVVVGPYTTREECDDALPPALRTATAAYIDRLYGATTSTQVEITDQELRRDVLRATWQETVDTSVGPMVKLYGRLQFDERMRQQVEHLYRWVRVENRLQWTVAATVAVLLTLGGAHVLLRAPQRAA